MGRFNCTRCGGCCKATLFTNAQGNTVGLWLNPSETSLFPAEVVTPMAGHGNPIQVTAYQLSVNRCPHYEESPSGVGRCFIYNRRPTACRSFPVISRHRVSGACAAISRIKDGVEPDSLTAELAAHDEEVAYDLSQPEPEWVWPLNERRWVPLIGPARPALPEEAR